LGLGPGAFGRVAGTEDNAQAEIGKLATDLGADAAVGAGDQGDASARHRAIVVAPPWVGLLLVVLERDPEADAVARDLSVLNGHVLADDLADPQLADGLAD